jgi:hypothetical protein
MSSRIQRDGKSAIEKAQGLKKAKNLEVPKCKKMTHGFNNSFAALNNSSLLEKAKDAGINLGDCDDMIELHINTIKDVEIDRLEKFHSENPGMFLPSDINYG